MFNSSNPTPDDNNVIDMNVSKNIQTFFKFVGLGFMIVFVLILLFLSIYRLETGTVGVVTRFGSILTVNEEAGIHLKMPFIDRVQKVDLETIYNLEYGYSTATSGSPNQSPHYRDHDKEELVIIEAKHNNASIILLNLTVRYQIDNPVYYLYEVHDLESTMRLALEDVVRSIMPSFSISEALGNKELIDQAILPKYQQKLNKYRSGVRVVQVLTQNVSLLPAVDATRQQVEESNQYKKGRQEEAQKYANTILPSAHAEATKLLEGAKGFKAQIVANANADVAEFEALYGQYLQNPQMVKEKYYIEAMQEVLANNKLVIDQTRDGGIFKFFDINQNAGASRKELNP